MRRDFLTGLTGLFQDEQDVFAADFLPVNPVKILLILSMLFGLQKNQTSV
jgi:hypothetical protein